MNPNLHRRRFLGLSAAAAVATALAACGGPSTASGGTAQQAQDLDFSGVTPASSFEFWSNHPGKSMDAEKELIARFEAKNPQIKVRLITGGANYEEIAQKFQTTQAAKGALPALVVLSDVWWFRYYMNKSIIPLDSLLSQLEFNLGDFRDALVKDYGYDAQQWAMPYARSTPLFYYNKDHFKAAGLPDRAPKTWAEFAQWAPRLKSASQAQYAFMYPALADYAGWTLQNNLWGEDGGWSKDWDINTDSDANVRALQFAQDSVYAGKWAGVASKDSSDDFAAGVASATISSTGSLVGVLKSAQFKVGVGFLPGGSATGEQVVPTGGAGLGIPAGIPKEQQLAAATFLKFVTEPENTALFSAATGYMPTRKSSDMAALTRKSPLLQTAVDQLAHTRKQDNARVFLPGADQEMAKAAAAILTQQAEVKPALTGLKNTLTQIYQKDVKPRLG